MYYSDLEKKCQLKYVVEPERFSYPAPFLDRCWNLFQHLEVKVTLAKHREMKLQRNVGAALAWGALILS